jgi:hypothetical protein
MLGVKQKEHEFSETLETFKMLTNQRAIDQANAEMERIDGEINILRQQIEPLDETTRDAFRELKSYVLGRHQRTGGSRGGKLSAEVRSVDGHRGPLRVPFSTQ